MRINDELLALIRTDKPRFSDTALLYLNRVTWDTMKSDLVASNSAPVDVVGRIGQLFGIPVMLYHDIPFGRWELVQRISGENITSGNVWEGVPGAVKNDPILILRDLYNMIKSQEWKDERGKACVLTGIQMAIKAIE